MVEKFTSQNRISFPKKRSPLFCSIKKSAKILLIPLLALLFWVSGTQQSFAQTCTAVCSATPVTLTLPTDGLPLAIDPNLIDGGSSCGSTTTISVSPATVSCADTGMITVTLTIIDDMGGAAACTKMITIVDAGPDAICQDITRSLDAAGTLTITGADVNNGSAAACGIASTSVSPSSFTCADIGPNVVTLTVTDNTGKTATCTATVTVEDTTSPTVTCQSINAFINSSGTATIVPSALVVTSNDNCGAGALVFTASQTVFDCSELGSNVITLTATDASNNTGTCTATVTVSDVTPPVAACTPITVYLDAMGAYSLTAADSMSLATGSADNCSFSVMSVSQSSFDCTEAGTMVPVSVIIADPSGLLDTCSTTVMVSDTISPVVLCMADMAITTSGGSDMLTGDCGAELALTPPTPTDNCPGSTVAVSFSAGTPAPASLPGMAPYFFALGETIVTYTATDANSNSSSCSFTVTVTDDENPIIVNCPADITINNDPGDCDNTVSWTPPTALDNCPMSGSVTTTITTSNGDVNVNRSGVPGTPGALDFGDFPVGTTQVTYTFKDGNGVDTTCIFNISVFDTIAPTFICLNDQTQQFGNCGTNPILVPDYRGLINVVDNCPNFTITQTPTQNTVVPVPATDGATYPVTITVTDNSPNNLSNSCTFMVTLEDTNTPVPDVFGPFLPDVNSTCGSVLISAPTATNACGNTIFGVPNMGTVAGGTTPPCVPSNFSSSPSDTIRDGSTIVRDTITIAGLSTLEELIVNVNLTHTWVGDLSATLTSPNGTVISLFQTPGDAIFLFGCGNDNLSVSFDDAATNNYGDLEATCNTSITGTFNPGPSFAISGAFQPQDALSAFDGEAVNGDWILTVFDNFATLDDGILENWSLEMCTAATGIQPIYEFTTGTYNVTWQYIGTSGVATQTQTIVVQDDNIMPDLVCQDVTVQLDENGQASLSAFGVGPTALNLGDDGLSGALDIGFDFEYFGNTFSQLQVSGNGFITFDLLATDGDFSNDVLPSTAGAENIIAFAWDDLDPDNGNDGTVNFFTEGQAPNRRFVLNFLDVPHWPGAGEPTVSAQVILYEGANVIEINNIDVEADDNDPTMTQGLENGNGTIGVAVPGRNNTDWDASIDNVTFIPDGLGSYIVDQSQSFSLVSTPVVASVSDNCGIDETTFLINGMPSLALSCADVGTSTITVQVTDINGNPATCNATLTVEDNIDPEFDLASVPANVTVACDNIPGTTMVTATDNCGTPTVVMNSVSTQSGNPVTCGNYAYTITRTWTATDNNSNTNTVSQVITVQDNDAPVFNAGLATTETLSTTPTSCDAFVSLSLTIGTDVSDACAGNQITLTNNSPFGNGTNDASGTYPEGTYVITFTATDPCGNMEQYTKTITIIDQAAPIASCISTVTVSLPPSGVLTVPASFIDNNSFDACGALDTMFVNRPGGAPAVFDCADADGMPKEITLTVIDEEGLSAICNTFIIIQDNSAPVLSNCSPGLSLALNAAGTASITTMDALGTGTVSSCTGIDTMFLDQYDFTLADVGTTTDVTLTIVGNNGVSTTCVVPVTVAINPSCFSIGDTPFNAGGAGETILVPVYVNDFVNIQSFQFVLQMQDGSVGEFLGVTNTDGTTVSNLPGVVSSNPFQTDSMTIQWNNPDPFGLGPINLADGEVVFWIEVSLIGNLGSISNVNLIATSSATIEVIHDFSGNIFNLPPTCIDPGTVFITAPAQWDIAGEIYTETGDGIAKVDVNLTGIIPPPAPYFTMTDGIYFFNDVNNNSNVTIAPSKNILGPGNWNNGVDVSDLAAIQAHIVLQDTLGSIYKKIAADATADGLITSIDLFYLQVLVSSLGTVPPPGNTSWRFVPEPFTFPVVDHDEVPSFIQTRSITPLTMDSLNNDFIGIKVGDVTNDVIAANLVGNSNPRYKDVLSLVLEDSPIKQDETYEVAFKAKDFKRLNAYQFTLEFNQEVLSYVKATPGELNNLSELGFGTDFLTEGVLIMTWFDAFYADLDDETVLFTLNFKAKEDAFRLSDLLKASSSHIVAKAYNANQEVLDIQLTFANQITASNDEFLLMQNNPNPFKNQTTVGFVLPQATTATLTITDISGRALRVIKGDFAKGYNEITLDRSELSGAGVVYYQLDTPTHAATKKMIIIE